MSTREGFGEETGKCIHVNGEEGTYNGPERRRTDFEDEQSKLRYDAANIVANANSISEQQGKYLHPNHLIRRKDDDIDELKKTIITKAIRYIMRDSADPDLKK